MRKGDIISVAITLGVKREYDNMSQKEKIYRLVKAIHNQKLRCSRLCYVFEPYNVENRNEHIHVTYCGESIFWKKFNEDWGIGFVKNKPIYSLSGWLSYMKKYNEITWLIGNDTLNTDEIIDTIVYLF